MHSRVGAHDWASTPLGRVESWQPSLAVLVKTLLASRYPMVLTWGPRLIQIYNDAYSRLIGDKHPSALGEDIRVTLAEAWDTLGPLIQEVMATGRANWIPALLLLLERNGYREESYFSVSHAPAEDDAGAIAGMLAVCSEVTEQVLGERRLRLLRDLSSKASEMRTMARTCQDVAATVSEHPLDVPFALLYLRAADGRTLKLSGVVGLEAGGAASPASVSLAEEGGAWPLARAAAGETVRVDDVTRHLAVKGGPWGDAVRSALVMPIASSEQSAPLGVLVAGLSPNRALDEGYASFYALLGSQVSVALRNAQAYEEERRRAEVLAELDRAKTAFFSNVSHEFRTPLTLMLGPLEDLLATDRLPPQAREELRLVHRNAMRLLRLVNTLLDFSRLEAGRLEASFEPTDLATFTTELASSFDSAVERAGLTLMLDCPPLPAPTYVDREMWEKIVLNLLSNALKFTFEGGIHVRLREQAGQAVLEVSDTGTGIPQADLPHLFERFYRVRGAKSRTHEGTGIGLSLVRELVRMHGGEVRVESQQGRGTTFTVSIPQGVAHLEAERIRAPRLLSSTASGVAPFLEEAARWGGSEAGDAGGREERSAPTGRIILADDNADMRDYVRRVLSSSFEIEAFPDGQAALEAALAHPPDLVLTDVMMPGLDGFALLRALREDPRTRGLPVVMLSARAGEEAAIEGLEAGADDYLVKPFSARELRARVRSNVELARMRRELSRQEGLAVSLREAIQARDEFLSVASHELKTPLAAFRLQLDLIERQLPPESRALLSQRLGIAARQVQRLHGLVETLLDVSQISMGRLSLRLEDVDLSGLVRETVERMREELERAGSPVTLETQGPLVGRYDRLRIEQLVTNLLSNAARYGEQKPVEVQVREVGGSAVLTVKDQGIGIAPEDRSRIFERFERAVSVRKYGGFGLGLWIARQVVEAHGGRIQVDSTPGQGSAFTVELPHRGGDGRTACIRRGGGAG
ncbi:hybrid sensor histidine kinase/response regulator [Hyalangium gracile]|uniref:hybrid sensor histidine kinase/response regulator n=1 Tax=Hyalangium gracile TaxID=394092 RepID=UPI001CC8F6E6|nr:ATP-binding protein [Hyalangium gracile]